MKPSNEKSKKNLAKSIFTKIYKTMVVLSPFGLILSIAFFLVQAKESKILVGNLTQIEQSLSTRFIGIFPDYLDKINKLLAETPHSPKDTSKVIIFEDVLFYGAFYNGAAFKEMVQLLTNLSDKGKRIVIAYYDSGDDMRTARMFREVIQESWMRPQDIRNLARERRALMGELRKENPSGRSLFSTADSIISEKYFAYYRDQERKEFSERIKKILVPLYDKDNQIFNNIDNLKNTYLNQPVNQITFHDIYTMCKQVTEELKVYYEQHGIKLIPLNNYLTMSCWSNGERVLFAFPGKYAADEIGFISHDNAILQYIEIMLAGLLNSLENDNPQ